jgi:CrcB protein
MTHPAIQVACVAAAGAAGALLRWGLSVGVQQWLGPRWPYGTLVVNVVGCFAFGLAYVILEEYLGNATLWRLLLLTGFAGAFTTYSTFAFETFELGAQQGIGSAAINVAAHLGLGLFAVWAGMMLGRGM